MEGFLHFLVAKIIWLVLATSFESCYAPSLLQDLCVGVDGINGVFVNGNFCKDPKLVTAEDFLTSGLNIPGNTSNRLGSKITVVTADRIPGLNTLGVALARTDFAPGGQVPAHTHPRGTELLVLVQGTLLVGFVSSNQDNNRLFSKILYPGDAFVFPIGMLHDHVNMGKTNAYVFCGWEPKPWLHSVADTVFGSNPLINPNVLARAFALGVNTAKRLQTLFPDDSILN